MDGYVTIATFFEPSRADFMRSVLEAEGISVFMANENFSALGIHNALLSGGMKLQVPEADAERATEFLEGVN